MIPLKRIICLGLAVSTLGLMTGSPRGAPAPQADKANWDNLKQLVSGQEIWVVLNDAKSYRGRLQAVSDDAIVVRVAGGEQTFGRQNTLRVSVKRPGHRVRNAALGGLAGAGVGAALGANTIRFGGEGRAENVLWGMALFGSIGAGVGAVLPKGGWRDVYRAR